MIAKTVVVIIFLAIVVSLGRAFFALVKDHGKTERVVKALTVRVALSVGLYAFLMLGYVTGILTPHGIGY
jgi:hypothetical protein